MPKKRKTKSANARVKPARLLPYAPYEDSRSNAHIRLSSFPRDVQVKVKKSGIPGAGRGLFAMEDIRPGQHIGYYTGLLFTPEEHEPYNKTYTIALSSKLYLDGYHLKCPVVFANDCLPQNEKKGCYVNSVFVVSPKTQTARLKAVYEIDAGAEIFVSYGSEYWEFH